jgi:hypothetical protein
MVEERSSRKMAQKTGFFIRNPGNAIPVETGIEDQLVASRS